MRHAIKVALKEDEKERLTIRLARLWERAHEAGLPVLENRKGERFAVGIARIRSAELVEALFESVATGLGGMVYRHHSGVVHATLGALLASMTVIGQPDEHGSRRGRTQVTVLDIELQMTLTALEWIQSYDRTVHLAGWPQAEWEQWRASVLDVINEGPLPSLTLS